jgi:hypothetical protein
MPIGLRVFTLLKQEDNMTYQNDPFQFLKSFGVGYDTVLRQMEQAKDALGNFKNIGYPPFNVKKPTTIIMLSSLPSPDLEKTLLILKRQMEF